MGEIHRVCEHAGRNYPDRVEVRPPFKENQLKTELPARFRTTMSRVVPPLGLHIILREQPAGKTCLIVGMSKFRRFAANEVCGRA